MRNRLAAAAVGTTIALAAATAIPLAAAAPQAPAGSVVRIAAVANGLAYSTKTLSAKAGKVTIVFTNRSQLRHNVRLEVGEKEYGGTKTIGHGTTRVTLTLAKGRYHFYCSVPGHEDAGMSGYLTVG
ncbi:MAG TPA: plastocyanin/azurin family copper-binding protein [Gaiellaceae bacterium]|nr:plastocyanin/azurin family copper-binding protein [Gaiellaceae bacterium]